jgi:rubrerythrin
MEFNHDEVRRQLREAEQAQKDALPKWRDALMRVFAGDQDASQAAKEQLTGAPGRRQFLKIGGVTVAGAAVLAACGKDDNKSSSTSTTAAKGGTTTAATPTTAASGGGNQDAVLLRTATSLELLAVAVYGTAIPLIKDATIKSAATLFMEQHSDHAKELQAATKESAGASQVYTKPNDYVNTNVVKPALPTLKTDADIGKFALTLENTAAATYVTAAGLLSTPDLRAAIMAIGGVEARHAAVLSGVLMETVPAMPFFSTKDTVPQAAFIK